MLKPEENERLTRVGRGTPMGDLLRRYWFPVAAEGEMRKAWTKRVRLLGEDLVLFRARSGGYGLVAEACPHRRASLAYGIPESDGLRCPYHGWKFDAAGACIEQPNEPAGSTFHERVRTDAYPISQLGGLLWAYLGPLPAPQLLPLDGFCVDGAIRTLGHAIVPCNWLQIMENSVDSTHAEWLHGHFAEFIREKDGIKYAASRKSVKVGFDEFEYGITKRRMFEGQTEEDDDWKIGHPVIFPNVLAIGNAHPTWRQYSFQIRVPVDDTHTQHYWYDAFIPPPGSLSPPEYFQDVNVYPVPFQDADGKPLINYIYAQDIMVWTQQGPIADRSREGLGATDRGVTLLRRMLMRELERVAAGDDPKCVLRSAPPGGVVDIAVERHMVARADGFAGLQRRHNLSHSPLFPHLVSLFDHEAAQTALSGAP